MFQDDLEHIINDDDDETIPHTSSTSSKDVVTSAPFIQSVETSRCEKQTKIVYLKTHKVSFKRFLQLLVKMHFTRSAPAVLYKTSFFASAKKTI